MVSYLDRSVSNADTPTTVYLTFLSAETIFKETPFELIYKLHFFLLFLFPRLLCIPQNRDCYFFFCTNNHYCFLSSIKNNTCSPTVYTTRCTWRYVCVYVSFICHPQNCQSSMDTDILNFQQKALVSLLCQISVAVSLHSSIN